MGKPVSPPTEKANPGHSGTAALWRNELSALAATLMLSPSPATIAMSHGCGLSLLLPEVDVDEDALSNVGHAASHATTVFGVGGGSVGVGRGAGGETCRFPLKY